MSSGNHIQPSVRQTMLSSLQHYGHSGIVDAARDLFMQIEGYPYDGMEKWYLYCRFMCMISLLSFKDKYNPLFYLEYFSIFFYICYYEYASVISNMKIFCWILTSLAKCLHATMFKSGNCEEDIFFCFNLLFMNF